MNTVAIVIPIYKPQFTPFEQVAIDKCIDILGDHPIIFVAPESLNTELATNSKPSARLIRFDDKFFKGIASYNQLMLSRCFYEAFLEYEYILIYQADAYIFEDNLLSWCKEGYDYIGAPWIPSPKYERGFHRLALKTLKFIGKNTRLKSGIENYYHVGNGGFSLRKVSSFLHILESEDEMINRYLARKGSRFHEDIFWGVEMAKRHKNFKVPKWKEALKFSFDVRPQLAYQYSNYQLPMGCHGWHTKSHYEFWKNHIKTYPPKTKIC